MPRTVLMIAYGAYLFAALAGVFYADARLSTAAAYGALTLGTLGAALFYPRHRPRRLP